MVNAGAYSRLWKITSERSSGVGGLENLKEEIGVLDFGPGDQGWLVIDRDAQSWDQGMLSKVVQGLKPMGDCHMAMSNPCFELWLLYHHETPAAGVVTSTELVSRLREVLGAYSKSNLDTSQFLTVPLIDAAIANATIEDIQPSDAWPNQRGSRVYKLVEALREFLKE